MKNITLSADEHLIQLARKKALKSKRTLNALFREWLTAYTKESSPATTYTSFMQKLRYVEVGEHVTRDDLNAR